MASRIGLLLITHLQGNFPHIPGTMFEPVIKAYRHRASSHTNENHATMWFLGNENTGTDYHIDWSEGWNWGAQIVSALGLDFCLWSGKFAYGSSF